MEAIREENEVSGALLAKLTDDMMPTKLFCHEPTEEHHLWVFWSHEPIDSEHTSTNPGIQDRIKIALSKFNVHSKIALLVQFWAAEMIEGQRHLTATLQPFALTDLRNEKLNEYRKHCAGYKFFVANVENNGDLSMDGIVGRVFRTKLPACCGDLSNYSVRDYPQRDLALSCGINSTFIFPLFETEPGSGGVLGCVGVLEMLFNAKFHAHRWYFNQVNPALKFYIFLVGGRSENNRLAEIGSKIKDLYKAPIRKEIKAAVKQVVSTYHLRHAVTWVRYGGDIFPKQGGCKDFQEGFRGELLIPSSAMSYFAKSITYAQSTVLIFLSQGLVEKAFSYNIPYFCRDVSKLRKSNYCLARMARKLQLASCFIVCLRNISTGKHEVIIQFSKKHKKNSRDPVTLFSSILAAMKQQLKTFEVVTDPQIEIFIEIHEGGESFVIPMTSEGEHIPTEYSLQSLHSTECILKSMCRTPVWPPWNRRNGVNESDQVIPKSSSSVNDLDESEQSSFGNSETASSNWVTLYGYRLRANQPHILIRNQRRRIEYSHFDRPISEASVVVAHNVVPFTPVPNVELVTIKVSYRGDIIKFDVLPSSSMEDLVENVIHRLSFLKDKAFVIKYLDDSNESLELKLLATDTDLQECMVRTRTRGGEVIRTVIELQNDAQDLP